MKGRDLADIGLTGDGRKMRELQATIESVERACAPLSAAEDPHLGNALLNVALGHLVAQYGQLGTAGILSRIVDALATENMPQSPEEAMDVLRTHG